MINIFLAIIVDAYAGVTADAKERGTHTVFDDLQKVRTILVSGSHTFSYYVEGCMRY